MSLIIKFMASTKDMITLTKYSYYSNSGKCNIGHLTENFVHNFHQTKLQNLILCSKSHVYCTTSNTPILNAETKKIGWNSCAEASLSIINSAKVLLNLRKTCGTVKLIQMPHPFLHTCLMALDLW